MKLKPSGTLRAVFALPGFERQGRPESGETRLRDPPQTVGEVRASADARRSATRPSVAAVV
ncbi:hypothetical protein [Halorussus salinisoli]|uniref:hypothetical protein n=1 Tax=Halorussus salinisoli TaxID=2558242 RepID=UPI0010C15B7D|nr:hypothetical protein [Halorussus salinisoli]